MPFRRHHHYDPWELKHPRVVCEWFDTFDKVYFLLHVIVNFLNSQRYISLTHFPSLWLSSFLLIFCFPVFKKVSALWVKNHRIALTNLRRMLDLLWWTLFTLPSFPFLLEMIILMESFLKLAHPPIRVSWPLMRMKGYVTSMVIVSFLFVNAISLF